MSEGENLHKNHRKRVKSHMLKTGFDGFSEHQILEALLFYATPRADTNPTAHLLLNRFGCISSVLDASVCELSQIPGIKENASLLIKLVAELAKIYWHDEKTGKTTPLLDSTQHIADFMMPQFIGTNSEGVYLICVDSNRFLVGFDLLMHGSIDRTPIDSRKVIECALKHNAAGIILAHNHPHASANPSNNDIVITTYIKKAVNAINIDLIDHIVISGKHFTSMSQLHYI